MDEEREEGGPTSKTTQSGEHGPQSKAKRRRQERADSSGPSCVSMKSDRAIDHPPDLKDGRPSREESPEQEERADSPGPSCVSMKSDRSMDRPVKFEDGNQQPSKKRRRQERADSPGPSCVSMKSDWSMNHPPLFKDGRPSREERQHQERSKVTSAQSVQQHQTELIKRAEEVLFLHYPQCSESQREEEEVDGKNEEQRRRAIEGEVDTIKLCLVEMNQEELADTLWAVKRLLF